ncbi:MAG TPA: ABC transporter permease [Vicinamibacterales bacterium]|jgi:predicted permease
MSLSGWFDGIAQDLRYALRGMRRSPTFTAAAVLTLALGIGANTIVFTVTSAILFRGFRSVADNERIVYIDTQKDGRGCCAAYPDFDAWRSQTGSFAGIGGVADLQAIVDDGGNDPEKYDATRISAAAFSIVGARPLMGRDFTAADEARGAAPVAILRYGLWERRYGRDPAIIGRTIRLNGVPTTVIGVMDRSFSFPQNQDLWIPLAPAPDLDSGQTPLWFVFGRLRDGVSIENAQAELNVVASRLANAQPLTNRGVEARVRTFSEFFIGSRAAAIYGAMWAAVGFVLLIACANLANLMLARAISRAHEVTLRLALGAERWQIVRQVLIESLLLSVLGGAAGWWIARWGLRVYELAASPSSQVGGSYFDNILDYSMDARVLLYASAISIGSGLLFGLVPAIRLSRLGSITINVRGGCRDRRATRLSTYLVVAEVSLAVVLLGGAGVLIRSFVNLYTADLGVKPTNVLTMYLNLPEDRYPRQQGRQSFFDRLGERLNAIPGVESSAIASAPPVGGSRRVPFELAGDAPLDEQRRPVLSAMTIGPGYVRTIGATVIAGREFNDHDGATNAPNAIVNQQFASQYWPNEDALGKRVRLFERAATDQWVTVVGVISNIVQNDQTRQEMAPLVYLPYRARPSAAMWVFVRSRIPAEAISASVRRELTAIDPILPIWLGPFALADRLAWGYAFNGSIATLFLIFAAIALLMAAVGLYAVIAHSVSQREREIGIRIAIGATSRDVIQLILAEGVLPLAMGIAVGLAGSLALNRVLQSELVRVSAADPLALSAAGLALVTSALLGCLIPARRATRVDPAVALRHE